jgi:poly(glycerol-phosphate) alpha-glucosyltransferase
MLRFLRSGSAFDVYHGHGIWEMPVHYMAVSARRRECPYVIAPRGMLEPWALNLSRWKKRVAGWAFQNRDLRRADCLHALNRSEVESLRRYRLDGPVAVVGNGVDVPDVAQLASLKGVLADVLPESRGRPVALFLSRLHPKKGLLPLLDAWREIHRQFPDWLLVVAGPDQQGHRAEAERRVGELELDDAVAFSGPLYGAQKHAAYSASELFVLPSFSEGFSMAVLEAMGAGLPVLITPGCHFPQVDSEAAGVIVEPQAQSVATGLHDLISLPESERRQMGARGRRLVETEYTWSRVAERMLEVYEWLLGRRSVPSCVVTD